MGLRHDNINTFMLHVYFCVNTMYKYEEPTRSIPITTQSQDLFMLQQAKLRVERNHLNNDSGISKRDSRYHAKLSDTIDQERVNRNVDVACNRQKYVPPKVVNKSAHPDNNIALYDLHSADINNTHILGNLLPEKYKYDSQRKIQYPNSWVKDYDYISTSFEDSGLPERYTQGDNIQVFPTNKEAFDNKFNELITNEKFTNEQTVDNKVRNPYYTFMGRNQPNLQSENINDINTYGYNIDNTTNGTYSGYLDSLQPSSTNLPKQHFENYTADNDLPNAARFPDERMQQNLQSYQRQFRDENSRITSGWNLHKSDYIKERNARQREADIALQHNGVFKLPQIKTSDYVEFLDQQTRGSNEPIFNENDFTDGLSNKYNERNKGGFKLSNKPDKQPTANTLKVNFNKDTVYPNWVEPKDNRFDNKSDIQQTTRQGNITRQNNIMNDIDTKRQEDEIINENFIRYDQAIDNNLKYSTKNNLSNYSNVSNTLEKQVENHEESQQMKNIFEQHKTNKPNPWNDVRHRDVDYRLTNQAKQGEFYNEEDNKLSRRVNNLSTFVNDKQKQHQREINPTNKGHNQVGDSNYPIINLIRGKGIIPKETFTKAAHILVVKSGEVENVYTDPNIDEVAPVLITVDEQQRPIRTFATLAKNNLTIIQKCDPTYIDIANGDYYKDDFVSLTIPVNSLPRHLREHIKKANEKQTMSNRKNPNKVLSLSFDDLLELSTIIINERDKTKRLKIDTLKGYFAGNKFDEQMLYGYAEKIFTTPWVIEQIEKYERTNLHERNDRVVQKDTRHINIEADNIPKHSNDMSSGEKSFTNTKQIDMKNEQFSRRDLYFDNDYY